jgi:hypothetical protein
MQAAEELPWRDPDFVVLAHVQDALVTALTSGTLASAALDLLEAESIDMKDPLTKNRVPARKDQLAIHKEVA